ncbi:unnamed protein product [Closterium sp. NIES-65]|nr:unnamed protein product [Closterium sp. NIES-65]
MVEQATVARRITHVIFDMDGLILGFVRGIPAAQLPFLSPLSPHHSPSPPPPPPLFRQTPRVYTEGLYTVAQQRILSRFKREFTWALKVKMMGKKAAEAAKVVIEELGLQGEISAEEFLKEREALLREEFPHCKLLPVAEAAQVVIEELGLQGEMSAEEFLRERENLLREEFPHCKLLPVMEAAQVVIEELGLQEGVSAEEFLRERETLLREEFPHCKLLPGAERLIWHPVSTFPWPSNPIPQHSHGHQTPSHNIPMAIKPHPTTFPWPSNPIPQHSHGHQTPSHNIPMAIKPHPTTFPWPSNPIPQHSHGHQTPSHNIPMAIKPHPTTFPWPSNPIPQHSHGHQTPSHNIPMAIKPHPTTFPWPSNPIPQHSHGHQTPSHNIPMAIKPHPTTFPWPSNPIPQHFKPQSPNPPLRRLCLFSGAERLIWHLHAHNIPMAIGTGSPKIDSASRRPTVESYSPSCATVCSVTIPGLSACQTPLSPTTSSHKIHFGLKTANHTALFSLMRHSVLGDDPEVLSVSPSPPYFVTSCHCHLPITSSHKIHFGLKTANHTALFSLMRHSVLGDDPEVVNGKPAPDVFRVAAARFDPPPSPDNVLVFEDAPLGVDAARNAGM